MKFKHWYKIKGRTIILKKIIPTAISISLLTNMIFVSSSNSTWSDDGRYEIFKDTDITVHDIIEDDNTNVKLKGDTLVNLVNNLDDWVGHGTGIFTKDSNSLTISNTTAYSKFYKTFTLKPNTTYTYFVECENNSNTIAQSYFRHGSSAISSGAQFLGQTKPNSISIHRNYFVTNNDGIATIAVEMDSGTGSVTYRNVILVEGDYSGKNIKYFEGIQSSFENQLVTQEMINSGKENQKNLGKYKVEYKSTGKNKLFGTSSVVWNDNIFSFNEDSNGIITASNKNLDDRAWEYENSQYFVDLAPGTYTITVEVVTVPTSYFSQVSLYLPSNNDVWRYSYDNIVSDGVGAKRSYTFTLKDYSKIGVLAKIYNGAFKIQIEEGSVSTECEPYRESTKTYYLNSPLLYKDTLEYINGKATHVKRYKEITLDGSKPWRIYASGTKENFMTFSFYDEDIKYRPHLLNNLFKVYEHKDWATKLGYEKCIVGGNTNDFGAIYISIPREELITEDLDGLKSWIQSNTVKIVCELAEPKYEIVEKDLSVELFREITHISNNSNIPSNMEVIVDRTLNRALEALEIAKNSPSINNISQARYWVNLAKETVAKDYLQSEINDIKNIEGLTIDKKSTSANVDVYIKPRNTLSISLNTNNIVFEDYTGVEEMEKLKAVELSVSSSLPYSLNTYLESPITNSDGSIVMPSNILNIRESNLSNYKPFTNIKEKVILNDNGDTGNNNIHHIDIKISNNNINKSDIYKGVIKFEVQQK